MKQNGNGDSRKRNAFKSLQTTLERGTKKIKNKYGGGIMPLTETDIKRINSEMIILRKRIGVLL